MWWQLSQNALTGAIESGLIYGFVALGVYISFRILRFPDLTVDGSFPLGAAVVVVLILADINPWLATLAAAISGAMAGLVTAALNQFGKIPNLLASILTMTALYSVNLRIIGGANIPLMHGETIMTPFLDQAADGGVARLVVLLLFGDDVANHLVRPIMLFLFVAVAMIVLWWFLESDMGLAMRATGANPRMARSAGVGTSWQIFVGMAISNALVASGGALYAQVNRYADTSLGIGTIVLGLAAVIIGSTFLPWRRLIFALVGCVAGSILYWIALAYALNGIIPGMSSYDLNLVTAGLIAFVLIVARFFGRKI